MTARSAMTDTPTELTGSQRFEGETKRMAIMTLAIRRAISAGPAGVTRRR